MGSKALIRALRDIGEIADAGDPVAEHIHLAQAINDEIQAFYSPGMIVRGMLAFSAFTTSKED